MISVQDVTKRYGRVLANDHLSFDAPDGDIAVLVGPNGAGKSTIIKCIAGLLRFSGEIWIDGFENKSLPAKRSLGYVPETPSVYEMLTVNEHLEFISRAYRLDDSWRAWGSELLERLELTEHAKKLGVELSKGMQQKVSIACALLPRPRSILFDEPLVGLDPHAIKELKKLFFELKYSGCSVLISTHILDSVQDCWDVAYIMMRGRFAVARRRSDAARQQQSLESLYFEITEGADGETVP